MANDQALDSIPKPPGAPLVGNALTVDRERPIQHMMELADEYGPIFRLDIMGAPIIIVSGADLVEEICDETRFDKSVRGPLRRLRAIAGDGLFTSDTHTENWNKAHNILLPTFSQKSMGDYLPMMIDIAEQLMLKWERLNSDDVIDVPHDMVGLTLDTIGLCGFDYRFNSSYRDGFHPFIEALTRTLKAASQKLGLPGEDQIFRKRKQQLGVDIAYMNDLVDRIIRERRRTGGDQNDLLQFMLSGKDRKTGEGLSDENIRYQINTFLIAGHETTSGLLSFAIYFLLKNPDVLAKAYAEVDEVIGRNISRPPTLAEIGRLKYIRSILYEALRLWPTAPVMGLAPYEDELLGGKYHIPKGTFVSVLVPALHRDKAVWGEDPNTFNPDNFSEAAEKSRNPFGYRPFGNGQRACIGRQFAMQEAILVLAMMLQRFTLFDHSNYELKLKEGGSLKPADFTIKVKLRDDVVREVEQAASEDAQQNEIPQAQIPSHGTPLNVLFGSNLGATEAFAREIARAGELNGFDVSLNALDECVGRLPTEGVTIIASASYNGAPPDNAQEFLTWLEGAKPGDADGVKYVVLGCGNSDWASTFQAVPRKIDAGLKAIGAKAILDHKELDAKEEMDTQFQTWMSSLWDQINDDLDLGIDFTRQEDEPPLYKVEITESVTANTVAEDVGAKDVTVISNQELQTQDGENQRSTRHIEVALPEGLDYEIGDHLCVVPITSDEVVDRLLSRFGLSRDTYIRVETRGEMRSRFPSGSTFSILKLAQTAGEIQAVASRKDISILSKYTECPHTRSALDTLARVGKSEEDDKYRSDVLLKRKSVLDLLEEFPACDLPLAIYLELIPWMSPRFYSISSSSEVDPRKCSITVGVVEGPALSGNGTYRGTCSSYLSELNPGERFKATVRKPTAPFKLPDDSSVPIIMIGPGTGIAPFRGFLQERGVKKADGADLGDALLFYGCRNPKHDFYYEEEISDWQKDGLVEAHIAFSRVEAKKTYVQDLLKREQDRVWALLEQNANVYVCGDGARMEPDVRATLIEIYMNKTGSSLAKATKWLEGLISSDKYLLDVWVG